MLRVLFFSLTVWLLLLRPQAVQAQTAQEIVTKVSAAISAGDATTLAQYFGDPVEVIVNDVEKEYSPTHAQFVLNEFFGSYPVRTFTISHQGNSGETSYAMGLYFSTRGDFDTNIFLKKTGSTYQIYQIRFEQDK